MKSFGIFSSLLTAIVACAAFIKPVRTEQKGHFKNLQVLPPNISEDSLDMFMDMFCDGLNVTCSYCHVQMDDGNWDMASDVKEEKEISRYMLKMTFDINKSYFNTENETNEKPLIVTCMTCHKGEVHIDQWSQKPHK
jgi:hypothetical protein